MKYIFWLSIIWIVYVYAGYFLILMFLAAFKKNAVAKDDGYLPKVSLIIAAHNEEDVIRGKILESLSLDYPKEKFEIIVASDASTDRTDKITRNFAERGVKLVRQKKRRGKTAVQNLAASKASGEILIFSDATTIYKGGVIRNLVKHFSNPKVGCVGGEEHFINNVYRSSLIVDSKEKKNPAQNDIVHEASFFWKYEKLLREKESEFNTMIGVSGCVFAIRKELYEPLEDSLIEDFALPLKVASKGYRVVCEREAIAYERAAVNTKAELSRKTRIVTGGINVLWKMKYLLNPVKYPLLSFQLMSHKVARWCAPIFMFSLFASNMMLMSSSIFFFMTGVLQIAFYVLAITGHFIKHLAHAPKVIKMIYHFCIMNLAAIWGIFRFLRGNRKVIWQPVR